MAYDYTNPERFFTEPLMRYTLLPLFLLLFPLIPFTIAAGIMNDGGKYLLESIPFFDYYLGGALIGGFLFLIPYTILYFVRGWDNKEKWRMTI